MHGLRLAAAGFASALFVVSITFVQAGQQQSQDPIVPPVPAPIMPLAPTAQMGASITPAYEGWFQNSDGTYTMLLGYQNRNQNQVLDIPVGPNNRIEPGGPDYGQPTHFLIGGARNGRQYGVFSITVPKDFGTKKLTWTLTANGQPQSISPWLNPPYVVAPFFRADNGNSPPIVKFDPAGPELTGPPRGIAQTLNATVNTPVTLTLYASDTGNTVDQQNQFGPRPARGRGASTGAGGDTGGRGAAPGAAAPGGAAPAAAATPDGAGRGAAANAAGRGRGGQGGGRGNAAPITVFWTHFRGAGKVTFSNERPDVAADPAVAKMFSKEGDYAGKATTTATFSQPGEFVVRGQVNDASGDGGGGDQCCWTNVLVRVNVK